MTLISNEKEVIYVSHFKVHKYSYLVYTIGTVHT